MKITNQKKEIKPWYVYIVQCSRGAYYTGISPDVKRRVRAHNAGQGSKAVRALGLPVKLVYAHKLADKSTALRAEAAIKLMRRGTKQLMIMDYPKMDI